MPVAADGAQEDVSEYWLNLVDRLEEGLAERNYQNDHVIQRQGSEHFGEDRGKSLVASGINESYIGAITPVDAPPVAPKTKFNNTILENFYGEGVTLTKVTDHVGKEAVVKRLKSKIGPCIL